MSGLPFLLNMRRICTTTKVLKVKCGNYPESKTQQMFQFKENKPFGLISERHVS